MKVRRGGQDGLRPKLTSEKVLARLIQGFLLTGGALPLGSRWVGVGGHLLL